MKQSRARRHAPARRGVTREQVIDVLGDIDDAKIADIIATGATYEDLEEAAVWAAGEDDVMGKLRRPLVGVAARVHEILTADEEYEEERG